MKLTVLEVFPGQYVVTVVGGSDKYGSIVADGPSDYYAEVRDSDTGDCLYIVGLWTSLERAVQEVKASLTAVGE